MSVPGEISQNSILRMNDAKTMQLINLYEKEECLWNTELDDYKNRVKRGESAEKIAKILDIPYFEARHVVMKFKNLRNSYCQELKKISHSMNSGVDPEDIYRPKVFWFSKMDSFLRPHLQPPRVQSSTSYLVSPDLPVKNEPIEEPEQWVHHGNPEDILIPETSIDVSEPSVSDIDDWHKENRDSRKHSSHNGHNRYYKPAKRPKPEESYDVSERLKEISCKLELMTNRRDDCFDSFGKYVACLLRTLPESKAYQMQAKIVSLVTREACPQDFGVSQSDEVE